MVLVYIAVAEDAAPCGSDRFWHIIVLTKLMAFWTGRAALSSTAIRSARTHVDGRRSAAATRVIRYER